MILDRYLIREILQPFLLGLFGLTTVFLINQFVRLSDLFVGRGASLETLGRVLWVLLPPFLLITLPAAMLLAGIVAFSRLSADSEFVALKASGVSFMRLMLPVLLFAGVIGGAALALGINAEPWGQGKLKHLAVSAIQENAGLALTPGSFNHLFGDVVVYVGEANGQGRFSDIFISDERDPDNPLLITARSGELVATPEQTYLGFHLLGGEIFRQGEQVQRVRFERYDVKLKLKEKDAAAVTDWRAAKAQIDERREAGEPVGRLLQLMLDHTKNVTFGVACFIFGLLGPALGIHQVRSGRMGGFVQGIVLILGYYVLLNFSQALVMDERVPVMVGAWIPNAVFLLFTLYVVRRAQREKPLMPRWRKGGS